MKKNLTLISISAIPICILLIAFKFRTYFLYYHTTGVDPEFAFLFNGLNVALLKLKIWHIDHPGTPLQLFCGLIIRITHLFRGDGSIINDVLTRPEVYLRSINFALIFSVAVSNYLLGLFSFRYIKSILLSIILQLTPFLSIVTIGTLLRVALEPMIIVVITIFMIVLIKILSTDYKQKHVFVLALVIGFSIATKINTGVIIFIPLFILKTLKERLILVGVSIGSFFVFGFPVVLQIKRYFFWIKGIITHSGSYGKGANKMIDFDLFTSNFQQLITQNPIWTAIFILHILVVVLYFIPKVRELLFIDDLKYRSVLVGLLISFLILIFIVCKHYAYYYLLPGLLLINLAFVFIILSLKSRIIRNILSSSIIICLIVIQYPKFVDFFNSYETRVKNMSTTALFVEEKFNNRKKPLLMIPNYYGNAFKEYAMFFGSWWSGPGKREEVYQSYLKKIYPDSYIYNPVEKYFHYWGENISAKEILNKHDELIVSVGWHMEQPFQDAKLILDSVNVAYTLELIYENKESVEQIYILKKTKDIELENLIE